MILDTDVLIWDLRGNEKAKKIVSGNIPFSISVVTYMEIVQGMRNKNELNKFLKQISKWNTKIIHIDFDISTRAMIYIEEFYLSHSMQVADALIAATAIHESETLITANEKHYKHIPNIQLMKFIP